MNKFSEGLLKEETKKLYYKFLRSRIDKIRRNFFLGIGQGFWVSLDTKDSFIALTSTGTEMWTTQAITLKFNFHSETDALGHIIIEGN